MTRSDPLFVTENDFRRLSLLVATIRTPAAEALDDEINRARIVAAEAISPDVVTMNSRVKFVDLESLLESEVTLVYPRDANVAEQKISVLAPVGAALLGLKVDQSIEWPLPSGGVRRLRVVAVTYQPEASGDWHL